MTLFDQQMLRTPKKATSCPPTIGNSVALLLLLTGAPLLNGCDACQPAGADAGVDSSVEFDAGNNPDTGNNTDAGNITDAGDNTDANSSDFSAVDAHGADHADTRDSGVQTDSSVRNDSGDQPDVSTAPDAGSSTWRSLGVGGGGGLFVPSISIHDDDEIYMATDMGAVFHSTTFGASWRTVDFRTLQGGTRARVRFSSDPNVLYAIDQLGGNHLVKSLDRGSTWQPVAGDPCGGEAHYLFVDPNSTQRLLISDWSKLYFSGDGGAQFAEVYDSADASAGLVVAGAHWDGDNIYLGTDDGLLVSGNGGLSFAADTATGIPGGEEIISLCGATQGSTTRLLALTFTAGSAWAGFSGSEYESYANLYRLDIGQTAWTARTAGIGAEARLAYIAMADNNIDVAYVAGGHPNIGHPAVYKTDNGGNSWSSVLHTESNINVATGWAGSQGDTDWWFGGYALGFTVSQRNPNRLAITDLGFVHVSDDGGEHWRQAYVHPDDQNPEGANTPRGQSYRSAGVEQTSGWWLTWASANQLFGSWTDIRSIYSDDGGATWKRDRGNGLSLNTTYQARVHPTSGDLYAVTSSKHDLYQSTYLTDDRIDSGDGALMHSSDGGASWQLLHDFGAPAVWLTLDPNDDNTLYVSVVHSTLGDIYVTNNLDQGSAASWTRLSSPARTEGHPYNIVILTNGTLLVSYSGRRDSSGFTLSSGLFTSSNQGQTWQDLSTAEMQRWTKDVVVDSNDATARTWYVSVFSHWGAYPNEVGGLYRTQDAGASFVELGDFYRVESCSIDPQNPDHMYVATETAGLWETFNLSAAQPTFVEVLDYPFAHPMRIFFDPFVAGQVWVTSFGGGLRVLAP